MKAGKADMAATLLCWMRGHRFGNSYDIDGLRITWCLRCWTRITHQL